MADLVKVLYVEDDPDIRAVAEMSLEDDGFELEICDSGQIAIQKGEKYAADLLLLDVMMPGIDGPATLTQLRKYTHLKDTPVIFMTAKVQPNELQEYLDMGAIGVISKPFDPINLANEIHQLMDKA